MASWADLRELAATDRAGWPWCESSQPVPARPPGVSWPRISIVIPSYGQGRFIEETLRSIVLQNYPELEILVVDGGSTDETLEILRRFEPFLSSWTSEPDGGQSEAINKGFARATGDIVTFLGSDDVYEPGTLLDVARQWFLHPGCGAIVGAFRFMDEASRRAPEIYPPRLPERGPVDLALLPIGSWRLHQVSTFYTRRALDEVGRWVREDLCYTMDRELLYRVCRRFPTALAEGCYASFRRHETSKSVAMILPMSREMADLHLLDAPADEGGEARRRRRALWRQRRSGGYFKLARSGVPPWIAARSLVRALLYRPSLLTQRRYYGAWRAALRYFGRSKDQDGLR